MSNLILPANAKVAIDPRRISLLNETLEHLKVCLMEDFVERPNVVNSIEEVIGIGEKESFDVKIQICKGNPFGAKRELWDDNVKGLRCWIEIEYKALSLES